MREDIPALFPVSEGKCCSLSPVTTGSASSPLPALGRASLPDMALPSTPLVFQVKSSLDALAQKIATFTDVGNSLAHAEHLLKDLASFEEKSSVRTVTWVALGRGQPRGGARGTLGSPRKAQEWGCLSIRWAPPTNPQPCIPPTACSHEHERSCVSGAALSAGLCQAGPHPVPGG